MYTAQRGADGPVPGDLFLDLDVPDAERITIVRDGSTAQASHVWTGTGWSRLVPGIIRMVPSARPLPVRRPTGATALTLVPPLVDDGRPVQEHPLHQVAV